MNKRKLELIWFSKYNNYAIGFISLGVFGSISAALVRAETISDGNMIIEFESSNMAIATPESNDALFVVREMERDTT